MSDMITLTCTVCETKFDVDRAENERNVAEAQERWPGEKLSVICKDCNRSFVKWFIKKYGCHPKEARIH